MPVARVNWNPLWWRKEKLFVKLAAAKLIKSLYSLGLPEVAQSFGSQKAHNHD